MKLDFQDLSLGKQALLVFAGFIALAFANLFILSSTEDDLLEAAERVEAAKELQLLPEQLASTANLYVQGDRKVKSDLKAIAKNYEQKLNLFIEAEGEEVLKEIADTTQSIKLTLAGQIHSQWIKTSEKVQDLLFEPALLDTIVVETKEVPLYDSLNTITTETTQKVLNIANPRLERASNHIQESATELSELAKKLVERQKSEYDDKNDALILVPLAFLGITIAFVLFLITILYKKVYEPIQELNKVATHVSEGDLSIKSEYNSHNEIGKIARAVNKITENLRNATAFINNIENGKLDEEFKGVDEKNVSQHGLEGALLTMRDQMKRVEEEEKERKWSTEGLAKFVDILRSTNDDVYALGHVIISNLVKYTNSNQGGIYVLNEEEDNKYLELISLYAFNTRKYDTRSYRIGEGLVGQTFQERETIYLVEVPHEYIAITSGLGGANPKSVLLVPLKVNEDIYGVVELASFNEYKKYEIEFVEKLAESIASTIAGVKNNQRTRTLLEESQALTEQMQAQEEEMRQNMEELSATQEEMSRKEVEMTAQLTAINNSLSTAEFDMQGSLITANENYVKLLGYDQIDEISELPFTHFSNEDNSGLWSSLRSGISQSGNYIKKKKSGAEVNVSATFTPVKNKNGDHYKVIELILSIEPLKSNVAVNEEELENMKEVEEELRQNLEMLAITQEQLDQKLRQSEAAMGSIDKVVKIFTLDSTGKIININKAAEAVTGFSSQELSGQNIDHLIEENFISEIKSDAFLQKEITIKNGPETLKVKAEIQKEKTGNYIYMIWI